MAEIKNVAVVTRSSHERQALEPFEEVLRRYRLQGFSKQRLDNRIVLRASGYFQFGDLRVNTETRHIIIEVDHGGVTNLVKYWYCLKKGLIKNPIVLIHLYRKNTEGDYASHIELWEFLKKQMGRKLDDRFTAEIFTYHPDRIRENLADAVNLFERLLLS